MFVGYVYAFYCKITRKYYIGQTMRSMNIRVKEHLKKSESVTKNHFHNALHKYGIDNFEIKILHTVEKECKSELVEELNDLETFEITAHDSLNNGYNSNSGGKRYVLSQKLKDLLSESHKGIEFSPEHRKHLSEANIGNPKLINSLRGRIVTDETRKKISESVKRSYTEEHKRKTSEKTKGMVVSEETKEKLRQFNLGKHCSDETRRKLGEISRERAKDPEFKRKHREAVLRSWIIRKQKKLNKEDANGRPVAFAK